jgi:hypothetical protein
MTADNLVKLLQMTGAALMLVSKGPRSHAGSGLMGER